MLYIPEYNTNNCAYIYNSDIIRVYSTQPQHNTTITYKDYYIKSDYMFNEGSTTFGQYTTLPTCINSDRITTDYYYRIDFPQILFIFICLTFICFWIPWKIYLRLFRRYN